MHSAYTVLHTHSTLGDCHLPQSCDTRVECVAEAEEKPYNFGDAVAICEETFRKGQPSGNGRPNVSFIIGSEFYSVHQTSEIEPSTVWFTWDHWMITRNMFIISQLRFSDWCGFSSACVEHVRNAVIIYTTATNKFKIIFMNIYIEKTKSERQSGSCRAVEWWSWLSGMALMC